MNIYNVITLFPNLIEEWKNIGIVRQAIKNQLVNIETTNLREFGIGEYKQVDDAPYGGGPGMVLMPEPLDNAINSSNAEVNVFLTPSGEQLDETLLIKLLSFNSINLIAGRKFMLQSKDIIFVPPTEIVKWNRTISLLLPQTDLFKSYNPIINNGLQTYEEP